MAHLQHFCGHRRSERHLHQAASSPSLRLPATIIKKTTANIDKYALNMPCSIFELNFPGHFIFIIRIVSTPRRRCNDTGKTYRLSGKPELSCCLCTAKKPLNTSVADISNTTTTIGDVSKGYTQCNALSYTKQRTLQWLGRRRGHGNEEQCWVVG